MNKLAIFAFVLLLTAAVAEARNYVEVPCSTKHLWIEVKPLAISPTTQVYQPHKILPINSTLLIGKSVFLAKPSWRN